jgi:short-subunit dehydrogenase
MQAATQLSLGLSSLAVGLALARRAWRVRHRYSFGDRTRGLGLEIGRQLAAEGARIWIVARAASALDAAADELRAAGASFVGAIAADLRRESEIDRVTATVLRDARVVDVLINNAGVIEVGPFEHAQLVDFDDSLATHFWAPLHLIRKLLPHFRRDGDGRIVNISSIGGRVAVPHLSAYAAGKFALTGLSETLRVELRKSGICVTTVTPGLMRTGSYVNVRLRGRHEEEFRWFAAMIATPLTSKSARRAASQIIEAAREGRATVSPGWQSRVAQVAAALAPNTTAGVEELVDRMLPPPLAGDGDQARVAAEVDPGAVKGLLSARNREQYHQRHPAWS